MQQLFLAFSIPQWRKRMTWTKAFRYSSAGMTLYHHTPLAIGYGVTPDVEDGEVIVKDGYKLIIKNGVGGVLLNYGFECEKGAILEIK